MDSEKPLVGIVMGSDSDWPLVKKACDTLDGFGVPYETRVISAHRTPELAFDYSRAAEERGLKVVIAAAGGADVFFPDLSADPQWRLDRRGEDMTENGLTFRYEEYVPLA